MKINTKNLYVLIDGVHIYVALGSKDRCFLGSYDKDCMPEFRNSSLGGVASYESQKSAQESIDEIIEHVKEVQKGKSDTFKQIEKLTDCNNHNAAHKLFVDTVGDIEHVLIMEHIITMYEQIGHMPQSLHTLRMTILEEAYKFGMKYKPSIAIELYKAL
jgi:hypothetical protein